MYDKYTLCSWLDCFNLDAVDVIYDKYSLCSWLDCFNLDNRLDGGLPCPFLRIILIVDILIINLQLVDISAIIATPSSMYRQFEN